MQSHFRNLTVYRAALRLAAALFDLTQRTRYEARPVVHQEHLRQRLRALRDRR